MPVPFSSSKFSAEIPPIATTGNGTFLQISERVFFDYDKQLLYCNNIEVKMKIVFPNIRLISPQKNNFDFKIITFKISAQRAGTNTSIKTKTVYFFYKN